MNTIQLSLFDNISSNKTSTFNEVKLEQMLKDLRSYIKSGVINTSDTYFNIAYHRKPKIKKTENGIYQLYFAQSSDSERLLSAYEANPNIKPIELLGVGLPKGVLDRLNLHIKDNPNDTVKDIFDFFKIWNYPTYRWVHAQSISINEIDSAKELIVEWAILKENMQLELSEGKFTFMRTNKRTKAEDQIKVIPQCFDGLCLEKNFMKMIKQIQA